MKIRILADSGHFPKFVSIFLYDLENTIVFSSKFEESKKIKSVSSSKTSSKQKSQFFRNDIGLKEKGTRVDNFTGSIIVWAVNGYYIDGDFAICQ